MHIVENTLDDLMRKVLKTLIELPSDVNPTRGENSEVIGALLHLTNPLARLSRTETKGKPFSALGELLWYLAASNELSFISYYIPSYKKESEDGESVYGGYGPRLFNMHGKYDQISNVISLLKQRPNSRKAVIQIFDAKDLEEGHKEIPCTCSLQFLIRKNRLDMVTHMRSNDAFIGLPHDIFTFTMLQEIVARELNINLGEYKHLVASLHLYNKDRDKANQYLKEGVQTSMAAMPSMPEGSQFASIKIVLDAEDSLRKNKAISPNLLKLEPYWADLVRLLEIFSIIKDKEHLDSREKRIEEVKNQMENKTYNTHIAKRIDDIFYSSNE